MSKNLFNKIVLFAVVFFLAILAPSAVNTPSQTDVRTICTGLAIDKAETEGKVQISAQILIPEAGGQYKQSLAIVSHDGNDLSDAIEQMSFQIGKSIRFAHCCYIIISKDVSEENIIPQLDYLMRGNNIGNNTLLIHTDEKAKDLLQLTSNINNNEVDNLQIIAKFNEKFLFSGGANLKSFFADYLSPHHTSFMANIKMKEEQTGESGGSGESGSSGASGSGEQEQNGSSATYLSDKVTTEGEVAIFYKGKLACVLKNEERKQFNWLDSSVTGSMIQLDNVSDKYYHNAQVSFAVMQRSLKFDYAIENNIPIIRVKYNLGLRTEIILQQDGTVLPVYNDYITDNIKDMISAYIQNSVNNAMQIQKQYGFDVFNFYKAFNINCHKEWKKYLDTLDNKDNYMQNIEVFTEVNCYNLI